MLQVKKVKLKNNEWGIINNNHDFLAKGNKICQVFCLGSMLTYPWKEIEL